MGYVGLVTGACLAHVGHRVVCVDKVEERVTGLEEGHVPFYEPGLEELRFSPLCLVYVALDRGEAHREGAGSLGLGHPLFYGSDYPISQVS